MGTLVFIIKLQIAIQVIQCMVKNDTIIKLALDIQHHWLKFYHNCYIDEKCFKKNSAKNCPCSVDHDALVCLFSDVVLSISV